jgi:hypothetical protein
MNGQLTGQPRTTGNFTTAKQGALDRSGSTAAFAYLDLALPAGTPATAGRWQAKTRAVQRRQQFDTDGNLHRAFIIDPEYDAAGRNQAGAGKDYHQHQRHRDTGKKRHPQYELKHADPLPFPDVRFTGRFPMVSFSMQTTIFPSRWTVPVLVLS